MTTKRCSKRQQQMKNESIMQQKTIQEKIEKMLLEKNKFRVSLLLIVMYKSRDNVTHYRHFLLFGYNWT